MPPSDIDASFGLHPPAGRSGELNMASRARPFVSALTLALFACSAPEPEHTGPTVGVILDYTGVEASGFREEPALLLAARLMFEARGEDSPFRIVYRDTRDDPDDARRAARDLVDAGVDVVIGPSTDRLVPMVAAELSEADIVLVSPNPTIGDSSDERPWFRMSPGNLLGSTTPALLGEHSAREFVQRGGKRALVVRDDDVYDIEFTRGFRDGLTDRDGEVVAELTTPGSNASDVIEASRQGGVDSVVLAMSVAPAANLVSDVASGLRTVPTWLLTPRLKSEVLLINTPAGALDGAFGVSLRLPSRTSDCEAPSPGRCFVDVMGQSLGQDPFENTYFMYDAAAVVLIALDRVWRSTGGKIPQEELTEAIFATTERGGVQIGWNEFSVAVDAARGGDKVQYSGVTGAIVLTSSGSRLGGDTLAFEVKDHAFSDAM